MRRARHLLFGLGLVWALTGCGEGPTPAPSPTAPGDTPTASGATPTAVVPTPTAAGTPTEPGATPTPEEVRQDRDRDGYSPQTGDCDDDDDSRHPGAEEGEDDDGDGIRDGDGVDNNCNNVVDDETSDYDDDKDGSSEVEGDCDDRTSSVGPGLVERCDGRDTDCNGRTDDTDEPCLTGVVDCKSTLAGGQCSRDDQCGEGGACREGICYVAACDTNNPGSGGNQAGVPGDGQVCDTDAECARGSFCDGGICAAQCQEDDDCAEGTWCTIAGQCGVCAVDADCSSDQRCARDGRCIVPECDADADCEDGFCDLDQRCSPLDGATPPSALRVVFSACDDDDHTPVADLTLARGQVEAQVCLSLLTQEDSSVPGGTTAQVKLATLSFDASEREGAAAPLISLDPSTDGPATYTADTGVWSLTMTVGQTRSLFINVDGDPAALSLYGASPVVRAIGGTQPSHLTVQIPGGWGGAFTGRLTYEGARPSEPFTVVVDPSTQPSHAAVFPAASNLWSAEDLRGALAEGASYGDFTLTWTDALDLSTLSGELGSDRLGTPVLSRTLYRRRVLTGHDLGDGQLGGTFTETVRGLLAKDVVFTGTFQIRASAALAAEHAEALADGDDPFWDATSLDAAYTSGALPPRNTPSDFCAANYSGGPAGISRARCLVEGQTDTGPGCGFGQHAFLLADHLEYVETSYASKTNDAGYTDDRYASTGVCDQELNTAYLGAGAETLEYTRTLSQTGGSCGKGLGEITDYAPTDTSFSACCIDPNRLQCAAETFAQVLSVGVEADRVKAAYEIWDALADYTAGHTYDLQQLRFDRRSAELSPDIDAPVASFTLDDRVARDEAAAARLLPVLSLLLSPSVATGLGHVKASDLALCDLLVDDTCPFDDFRAALGAGLAAHQEALRDLGNTWASAGGEELPGRLRWLAAMTLLSGALNDTLTEMGGAPAEDDPAVVTVSAHTETTLGHVQALTLGRTRWGFPSNYIPNPTIPNGGFAGRLQSAISAVTAAGRAEAGAIAEARASLSSRAEVRESLQAKADQVREDLEALCGADLDGNPLTGDLCGLGGEGAMWGTILSLQDKLGEVELAEGRIDGLIERIRIKEAEANNTLAALQQLAQDYQANAEDLEAALDEIQEDYLNGWRERFSDYQDSRAELYEKLEGLYEELGNKVEDQIRDNIAAKKANLNQKCEALKESIAEQRAAKAEAVNEKCEKVVSCLQQAEAKRAKKKEKRSFWGKVVKGVTAVVSTGTCATTGIGCGVAAASWGSLLKGGSDGGGKGCQESCREEAKCEAEQEIIAAEADAAEEQLEAECLAAGKDIALEGEAQLNEALWQQERDQLQLMMAEEDGRLRDWYEYREAQMLFQIERQEERAHLASQQADAEAGVRAQVDIARAGFLAELEMLMVDLSEADAVVTQAQAEAELALTQASQHRLRADGLAQRLAEAQAQLDEALLADPSFRIVDTDTLDRRDTAFDLARQRTWLALRAYEIETSTTFEQGGLLDRALTGSQLCGLLSCLDQSYINYTEAFSSQTTGRRRDLSARAILGLEEPLIDAAGHEISPSRRFGEYLTSPSQLWWEASNQAWTRRVRLQTHSEPGRGWSWDEARCNEKIESIQVLILCEDCSPNEEAWVRVTPEGSMLSHSCRGEDLPRFDAPGGALKTATLAARIVQPPANGDFHSLPSSVWSDAQENRELVGLNAIFPSWAVSLVPSEVQAQNEALTAEAISDIVVRINYTDQSAEVWGGTDQGEAPCEIPDETTWNDVSDWSCVLP